MSRAQIRPQGELTVFAHILEVQAGLYEAHFRGYKPGYPLASGTAPFAILTQLPGTSTAGVQFLGSTTGAVVRLDRPGDGVFVSLDQPAKLLLTVYNDARAQESGLDFGLRAVSAGEAAAVGTGAASGQRADTTPLPGFTVHAHIQDVGDARFASTGWIGDPDGIKRLEGFRIAADGPMPMGLGLEAAADAGGAAALLWRPLGDFAGTRARALPVRRLAFRLSGAAGQSIRYQAAFADGTRTAILRDGAVAEPVSPGAPLVAFRFAVTTGDQPRSAAQLWPPR